MKLKKISTVFWGLVVLAAAVRLGCDLRKRSAPKPTNEQEIVLALPVAAPLTQPQEVVLFPEPLAGDIRFADGWVEDYRDLKAKQERAHRTSWAAPQATGTTAAQLAEWRVLASRYAAGLAIDRAARTAERMSLSSEARRAFAAWYKNAYAAMGQKPPRKLPRKKGTAAPRQSLRLVSFSKEAAS